jgi:hypothetical protein
MTGVFAQWQPVYAERGADCQMTYRIFRTIE